MKRWHFNQQQQLGSHESTRPTISALASFAQMELESDGSLSTPEAGVAENKASFASVRFQDFELDLQSGELRRAGAATVRLPEQSFVILRVLLEHSGKVVSRAEIQQRLWPDGTVVEFEHSIGAAMNRLRQVLADSAENPRFIETLSRRGYRWIAGAEWVADSRSSPPVATEDDASPLAPSPAALTTPPTVAAFFPWRKLAAWLSVGTLFVSPSLRSRI